MMDFLEIFYHQYLKCEVFVYVSFILYWQYFLSSSFYLPSTVSSPFFWLLILIPLSNCVFINLNKSAARVNNVCNVLYNKKQNYRKWFVINYWHLSQIVDIETEIQSKFNENETVQTKQKKRKQIIKCHEWN